MSWELFTEKGLGGGAGRVGMALWEPERAAQQHEYSSAGMALVPGERNHCMHRQVMQDMTLIVVIASERHAHRPS